MWIKTTKIWEILFSKLTIDEQKKRIRSSIFKLYEEPFSHKMNDRFISSAVFDAKYSEQLAELGVPATTTPSSVLTGYYDMANKGNNAFLSDGFYRVLAKNKDIEIKKLMYRLNRSR